QKTDIFKKLMWFSYQGDDSWIPLPIDRGKEIQQENLLGNKPEDIKDMTPEGEVKQKERTYDYENVVGQDSLTRLDDQKPKKKGNRIKIESENVQKNKRVGRCKRVEIARTLQTQRPEKQREEKNATRSLNQGETTNRRIRMK